MESYLESIRKQFLYYKKLAEETFAQLSEADLFWQYNAESNSIAMIVQHLSGNMLSRFTDFLTADGEKPWRNRDAEFVVGEQDKLALLESWNKGWKCLLDTLDELGPTDLERIIYIRNEGHTVVEALNRQLAHYPYHIGQIVFTGKMLKNEAWKTLSIERNKSAAFNAEKFSHEKARRHFTEDKLDEGTETPNN